MMDSSKQLSKDKESRLLTLSVPKRSTPKFEKHDYNEGRFNYNHYDERLHPGSFCPTVRKLPMYFQVSEI